MPRLAWFSPMAPARSGVSLASAHAVAGLREHFHIDVFVDEPVAAAARRASPSAPAVRSAHEFVWRHHVSPYDLTVYQLGNSAAHDFLWPYLFRYPGLAVLHDAHLHHARAAALLRLDRTGDYRAEFAAAHPDVPAALAELAIAGFDTSMYYRWPMTRLVVAASRVTAVHAARMAAPLAAEVPSAVVETIRLGHGELVAPPRAARARAQVRQRHGIPGDAILFGAFGGLAPDKRIPQILAAFAALLPYAPSARLLLVGAAAAHYDLAADIRAHGLEGHSTVTGYVDDEAFTDHIAACDVSVNLRWPTAREISGPWLGALAAGKPTIVVDLSHTAAVPSLDPRSWRVSHASDVDGQVPDPAAVALDILDEDHSLRLAFRRLATDAPLRERLSRGAVDHWRRHHGPELMTTDYRRVIARALATPVPTPDLPPHLLARGDARVRQILGTFGIDANAWSTI